jgi:Mn-dependent DtxR family transcriptional regulator
MVATTSKLAYREHRDAGKALTQEREIFEFIKKSRASWSRSELAERLGIRLSSVCGRVNELIADGKVTHADPRTCLVTGKTVRPVKLCAR